MQFSFRITALPLSVNFMGHLIAAASYLIIAPVESYGMCSQRGSVKSKLLEVSITYQLRDGPGLRRDDEAE